MECVGKDGMVTQNKATTKNDNKNSNNNNNNHTCNTSNWSTRKAYLLQVVGKAFMVARVSQTPASHDALPYRLVVLARRGQTSGT